MITTSIRNHHRLLVCLSFGTDFLLDIFFVVVLMVICFGTGFNAPLYRRHDEHSVFGTLNINASVSFWQANGLDKDKIVVGLPTYGHSFNLVNPFNAKLGAPANGYGRVGSWGKFNINFWENVPFF